jgi:hypothetical protein
MHGFATFSNDIDTRRSQFPPLSRHCPIDAHAELALERCGNSDRERPAMGVSEDRIDGVGLEEW